jgi:hypothetical protein
VDVVVQAIAESVGRMSATATQQADAATLLSYSMADVAQVSTRTRDRMEQMRGAMDRFVELAQSLLQSVSAFRTSRAHTSGWSLQPYGNATQPLAPFDDATEPIPTMPSTPNLYMTNAPRGEGSGPLGRLRPPAFEATDPALGFSAGSPLSSDDLSYEPPPDSTNSRPALPRYGASSSELSGELSERYDGQD